MSHGDSQSFSLAYSIVDYALMLTKDLSFLIDKTAGYRSIAGYLLHHLGIISVRHETYILTVRFICVYEAVFFSDGSCFCLGKFSQRKKRMRQFFLRKAIEHITLVL